jgi:hypothetical protein
VVEVAADPEVVVAAAAVDTVEVAEVVITGLMVTGVMEAEGIATGIDLLVYLLFYLFL